MTIRFLPRYGIPAEEVHNLHSRYAKQHLKDGFGSFDAFLRFASESGYQPGMLMRKRDRSEPHCPENTVFCERLEDEEQKRKKWQSSSKQRKKRKKAPASKNKNPAKKTVADKPVPVEVDPEAPCAWCKEKCPATGIGCYRWRKWFVEGWNEKIHYKPPVEDKDRSTKSRAFFCYEHPDLVREGIVFDPSR